MEDREGVPQCHRADLVADGEARFGREAFAGLDAVGRDLLPEIVGDQRACRSLWQCADRHTWWRRADQPEEPLQVCPVPELFR
ncbi:hypothetical protein [Streptomyces misionensis]